MTWTKLYISDKNGVAVFNRTVSPMAVLSETNNLRQHLACAKRYPHLYPMLDAESAHICEVPDDDEFTDDDAALLAELPASAGPSSESLMKQTCTHCGVSFDVDSRRARPSGEPLLYCSKRCCRKAWAVRNPGADSPAQKAMRFARWYSLPENRDSVLSRVRGAKRKAVRIPTTSITARPETIQEFREIAKMLTGKNTIRAGLEWIVENASKLAPHKLDIQEKVKRGRGRPRLVILP